MHCNIYVTRSERGASTELARREHKREKRQTRAACGGKIRCKGSSVSMTRRSKCEPRRIEDFDAEILTTSPDVSAFLFPARVKRGGREYKRRPNRGHTQFLFATSDPLSTIGGNDKSGLNIFAISPRATGYLLSNNSALLCATHKSPLLQL